MFSIVKKIASLNAKKLTTAQVGILQAYAYRALKAKTDEYLKEYDLTSSQWAILGLLQTRSKGMQPYEIAEILGVKKPYVTTMTSALLEKELIETQPSSEDKRAHFVYLTTKGQALVPIIEKSLRQSMKGLVKGASPRDLVGYIRVIKSISDNYKK